MLKRPTIRLFVVAFLMASAPIAACASSEFSFKNRFSVSGWNGFEVYNSREGKFRFCVVLSKHPDQTQLSFVIYKNGDKALYLKNKNWDLPKDNSYFVKIRIDNRHFDALKFSTASATQGMMWLDEQLFAALGHGNELVIETPVHQLRYSLNGTLAATRRLVDCHVSALGRLATPKNPFGSPTKRSYLSEAPNLDAKNPFAPDEGLSKTYGRGWESSAVEELKEFTAWARDFSSIYETAIHAVEYSIEIDNLTSSLIANEVTKEFAKDRINAIGMNFIAIKTRLKEKLDNIHSPELKTTHYKKIYNISMTFIKNAIDGIESLIIDSKTTFNSVAQGQGIDETAVTIKRLHSYSSIINLETTYSKIVRAQSNQNHPQYWFSSSVIATNEAMTYALEAFEAVALDKSAMAKQKASALYAALKEAQTAIAEGNAKTRRFETANLSDVETSPGLRPLIKLIAQSYRDNFENEREIVSLINLGFKDIVTNRGSLKFEMLNALTAKRMEIQKRRLNYASELGNIASR